MDYSKLQSIANKLHAKAKDGTLKFKGKTYTFSFDRTSGHYKVTAEGEDYLPNYNTRSLKQACQWLKEYLQN